MFATNALQYVVAVGEEWNQPVLAPYNGSIGIRLSSILLTTVSTRSCGLNSLNLLILSGAMQVRLSSIYGVSTHLFS